MYRYELFLLFSSLLFSTSIIFFTLWQTHASINNVATLSIPFHLLEMPPQMMYRRDLSTIFFSFFFSFFFSLFFISFLFISSAPVYAEIKCFLIIIICEHIIECILSPYAYNCLTLTNLNNICICISMVLNCINIPFIGYIFVTITLTTTPLPYRAVVYYIILRQYVISSLFVLLSTIAQCQLVLPAKCIDNETKGWADGTKRRTPNTARQTTRQTL